MDRNDYGRYRDRDERPRYQPEYPEREGERRWENEGGFSGRNNNDDDRRWAEGGQGGWQWREEWRNRHEPRDQSRNRDDWRSRDEWQARTDRDRDDRWGRFPPEGNRFDRNEDYRREGQREGRSSYYPSSGTYGSSSGSYGSSSGYGGSGYGATGGRGTWPGYGSPGYGSSGYSGGGYQGERSDRDYRGSYDDSPAINRESRPGYRPYQQATGQAGQDRYRYEEQVRRGKAPRSYKRSDDRIHDEICEIVARDSDVDASEVDVKVQNGEVTLAGTVEDRRAKRELEDIAERVFGVVDIRNDLRVRKSLFNELGERIFGSNDDRSTTGSTTQNKSQTGQKM